jgi:hypothetical protein
MWLVRQTRDDVSDVPRRPNEADKTSDPIKIVRPDTDSMSDPQEAMTGNGRTRVDMGKALALVSATPEISADDLGRELGCTARHADRIRKKLGNRSAPDERRGRDAEEDERQGI